MVQYRCPQIMLHPLLLPMQQCIMDLGATNGYWLWSMKVLSLQLCFNFYLLWIQSWSSIFDHFDVLCNYRCHGNSVYWLWNAECFVVSLYVNGTFDLTPVSLHFFIIVNSFAEQSYFIIIQLDCYVCLCTWIALDERWMIRIGCGLWDLFVVVPFI